VSSKKVFDPNEQQGESISLSELHGEIVEPAQVLSQKKDKLPQHDLHGWPPHHPGSNHYQ